MLRVIASIALLLWSLVACVAPAPSGAPQRATDDGPGLDEARPATSEAWHRAMRDGMALYEAGRFAEATPLLEQALRIAEEQFDAQDPVIAASANNLALLYKVQGRMAEAEKLYRRSLAISEQALGPEDALVAKSLDNLAGLYIVQGRIADAEPLLRKALPIFEKALGPQHPDVATNLNNLAQLYYVQGRYAEAEPLYRRSLAILEQALWTEHPDVAVNLDNLAQLYTEQGRYAEAEPLYRRALAIFEQAFGPEHPDVAKNLRSLGVLYSAQGRYAEAERLYRRSLEIFEQAFGPEHPDVATNLHNLASLYKEQGRYAEAESLYRRSLEISEQALGAEHPEVAKSLDNLAGLYADESRYVDAERLHRRALAIFEQALGPEHPDVATNLHNLASTYSRQSRYAEALPLIRRADAIQRRRAEQSAELRAGPAGPTFVFWRHVEIAWGARGVASDAGLAGEALEAAQLASADETAAVAVRMAARFASGGDALAALVRQQEQLADRARVLERAIVAASARAPTERNPTAEGAIKDELAAVSARLDAITAELRQSFPEYSALVSPAPVPLAESQALLGPDEALLVMLLVGEGEEEGLYVWLIRSERVDWQRVALAKGRLAADVAELRAELDPGQGGGLQRPFDAALAHDLYRRLLPFDAAALRGVRHLLVVPDGPLQSLPFHLLVASPPAPGAAPSDLDWLARSFAVTTLPAVTTLRALRQTARPSGAGQPFLGIGDPVLRGSAPAERGLMMAGLYDARGLADVKRLRALPALPETADELRALAAALGADERSLLLGPAATETAVKAADLPRARVVAFATHAAVAGQLEGLAEPAIVLTPPEVATERDDGLLTASEVAQLKLDADFVLLSACNTAAPDGTPGASGLSGLAKAFVYAGTRSLLVSHWEVYSAAAERLTTGMFAELARDPGIGRAEALRRSMLALIEGGGPLAHPAAWAPFVVVGEGGAPLRPSF